MNLKHRYSDNVKARRAASNPRHRTRGASPFGPFQACGSLSDLARNGFLDRKKGSSSPNGDTPRLNEHVISVALIEDNRLVREGVTSLLNNYPDIWVVGTDPGDLSPLNGHDSSPPPQVILLNIGLRVAETLRMTREIRRDYPGVGIVMTDLLPSQNDVLEFISAGVSGFIMKDATLDEVSSTIRSVAGGVEVLPDGMTANVFSEIVKEPVLSGKQDPDPDSVRLTARERQVVTLVAEGMSNKAIGKALHVSIHTVKSHLRNIMEKLTLTSRLQIASYVHRTKEGAIHA
jgi:DNA-binding NarL/FixJ family response regulator